MKHTTQQKKNFHTSLFFSSFFILIINSAQKVLLETLSFQKAQLKERLNLTLEAKMPSETIVLRKEHKFLCTPCGKEFFDESAYFHEDKKVKNISLISLP